MTPAERLALFTTPVAELGPANDQTPAAAWVRWGRGAQWNDPTARPRIALAHNAWSWPIYSAEQATRRIRVWRSLATWDEAPRWSTLNATSWPQTLPWADSWRPAWAGEDGGILIDDDSTGAEGWEALNLRHPWFLEQLGLTFRTLGAYRPGDWICDQLHRRTKTNAGTFDGRGCGAVPKRAGVTTAAEAATNIPHALALTGITQWGAGARCVAPATRVEHPRTAPKGYPAALGQGDRRALAHGTRLAIDLTDYEIASWATGRGYRGVLHSTACTLVRALRDFGAILVETGVGDPQIETTGIAGPDRQAWAALGITEANAVTLLDGLPWSRLFVVAARP